jgi:hypothetical protein
MTTLRLLPGRVDARANSLTDSREQDRGVRPPAHHRLTPLSPLLDISLFDDLDVAGVQALLRDLSFAVLELARDQRARLVIPTEARSTGAAPKSRKGAVWEVGLERDGEQLVASVFRQGSDPLVAQSDRCIGIVAARRALLCAMARNDEARADDGESAILDRGLALAREQLEALSAETIPPSTPRRRHALEVVSHSRHDLTIQCAAELRRPRDPAQSDVARADLHSLLFRGDVSFAVGKSVRRLEGVHVFLFAEQLLSLTVQLLDARASERAMQRRVRIGAALVGVQRPHRLASSVGLLATPRGRGGVLRAPALQGARRLRPQPEQQPAHEGFPQRTR